MSDSGESRSGSTAGGMSTGVPVTGAPLGPDGITALEDRFRQHLEEALVAPVEERLDRYVHELETAIDAMAAIDIGAPSHGQSAYGAPPAEAPSEPVAEGPPEAPTETPAEARTAARARLRYAERFGDRFGEPLLEAAARARAELFQAFDEAIDAVPPLPDTVLAEGGVEAEPAPELVRPGWTQRLAMAFSRPSERAIPVRLLAELYIAELSRRLEPTANNAARLTGLAVAAIRHELHDHTELAGPEAGLLPDLEGEVADIMEGVRQGVAAALDGFGRALRATALDVPERRVEALRDQTSAQRARALDEWAAFEAMLMANVAAEAVLARALAAIEATVAAGARRFEHARDRQAAAALERLATGLVALGDRAERELPGGDTHAVLEELASEAAALFGAELPGLDAFRFRLEELAGEVTTALAEVPGLVPDDLQISESPVPGIPGRPRKLQLRDAPLGELISTACMGTLPRWIEKSLATAGEELEAMGLELDRVRNAVRFQLRAPLRGGFSNDETVALAVGITDRTVAQLEDLRAQGLTAVDELVEGLESRAREEADALRSAVANREFLRIQSEIAEEQAVRQLSTGIERTRSAALGLGRGARTAWRTGTGWITAAQDWAERQLGVDEVERADMLESLEQSLLGAEQQVVAELPPMYRQLFDVEAGVPWDELLVPRDDEVHGIRRAYDRWREDRSASLAIVGEKGSGKSTLIRLARQHVFDDTPVREIVLGRSIDDPDELRRTFADGFDLEPAPGRDLGSLVDAINRLPPCVAVVEDLHHLFIRALGGFEAIEAFLEIAAGTGDNVLWVVTVDETAWRYLDRVVGIGSHFVHEISTTNLSADELERAIMARHEVSGFALRFETTAREAGTGTVARLLGRQTRGELTRKESQRRRYFQELAAIAEGNIVLALFYWLRSIQRIDEHVLVLDDPEIIDLEFLERLPLAQLHTIAAIILHGGLSEAAHRRIFQLPAAESRLLLAALADAHMVFLAPDGEYKINKVLYRPFIRLLAAKNIF